MFQNWRKEWSQRSHVALNNREQVKKILQLQVFCTVGQWNMNSFSWLGGFVLGLNSEFQPPWWAGKHKWQEYEVASSKELPGLEKSSSGFLLSIILNTLTRFVCHSRHLHWGQKSIYQYLNLFGKSYKGTYTFKLLQSECIGSQKPIGSGSVRNSGFVRGIVSL